MTTSEKKKIFIFGIVFIVSLFLLFKLVILPNSNDDKNVDVTAKINEIEIKWDEIDENNVDIDLLYKNIDKKVFEKVVKKLNELLDEELREEQENPSIVVNEGWTRIFNKSQYKEIIDIGKPAMKPLYYILYTSNNNGLYEYVCASALQEISGVKFTDYENETQGWSTAKEYLELFTNEIIKQK